MLYDLGGRLEKDGVWTGRKARRINWNSTTDGVRARPCCSRRLTLSTLGECEVSPSCTLGN